MPAKSEQPHRGGSRGSRRVGRVTIYARGKVWYIYYFENGRRIRRRVGTSLAEAKQLAAQANGQLAARSPALLSFEPISVPELRQRWLDHHEHVRRSSIATIRRYRAATDHLLRFVDNVHPVGLSERVTASVAEELARWLRQVKVSPNGHPNTSKRSLRDKGVIFILESCRAIYNFAAKHRHLPPYHDNPFGQIDIERIPIEDAKPIELFSAEREKAFLEACDHWQFPIFLTLGLTGMRPAEAVHLLLPDDVDLRAGHIRVRNKPDLGWRTKTRNERDIPICPELSTVLRRTINGRETGPLFVRRRFGNGQDHPILENDDGKGLEAELARRVEAQRTAAPHQWTRLDEARVARAVWRDAGGIKPSRLRVAFMRVTAKIGMPDLTCPKMLRHLFATCLQDANVDPLIRQELMGHTRSSRNGNGLGMTTAYTHTRDETRRSQFEAAMAKRGAAIEVARGWLARA